MLDFGYDDLVPGCYGWGVHRGTRFDRPYGAVTVAAIPTTTGLEVTGLTPSRDGWRLTTALGDLGPFDLVVGADGARSRLRRASGLASKDVGYPFGAIWSEAPDPDHLAGDVLSQRYDGTRITLGVLPTGVDQASLFWSTPTKRLASVVAAGPEGILEASYRDVVVRSPVHVRGGFGLVLIGDAAHAMSPQLGLGASLALADAWSLAACLRATGCDLPRALEEHAH